MRRGADESVGWNINENNLLYFEKGVVEKIFPFPWISVISKKNQHQGTLYSVILLSHFIGQIILVLKHDWPKSKTGHSRSQNISIRLFKTVNRCKQHTEIRFSNGLRAFYSLNVNGIQGGWSSSVLLFLNCSICRITERGFRRHPSPRQTRHLESEQSWQNRQSGQSCFLVSLGWAFLYFTVIFPSLPF